MRRDPLGVAALLCIGLLALTGCTGDAGAATSPEAESQPSGAPPAAGADNGAQSPLGGLVVVPAGYLKGASQDPNQLTGPFSRESFVNTLSPSPAEDLALLLNASVAEGYQAYRISPDRRKRLTIQLFKAGSKSKARTLQQGFWNQDPHNNPFAIPGVDGALSDARVVPGSAVGQVEAIAEASIVVGQLVAEIKVTQVGPVEDAPVADIKLIANLAKQQRDRLTTKSG